MYDYPKWFMEAVEELEEALAEGHIGHTDFNIQMEELEKELEEHENV